MTKMIRTSVLVALMLGTLTSYAGTTLVEKNGTEARVAFTKMKKGQRYYIKNSEGKVLHESIAQESNTYDKVFEFNSLENGYYSLEINDDFQIDVIPFTVVGGNTTFYNKEEKVIYKPVVRTENNNLLVSKIEFDATPLHVTIYYEGKVIFRDTVKGGNVLQRVYKLRQDIKGDYKVVMKANDRKYTNEFSL